ncbi:hypothetical protein A8L45_00220 [Veronia pacifica]|uniref:YtxH domain-containing protein n=2 Tax=Veronia pacifica TaxID=1080227 RepID=A0A1C3ET76_9GAMM|nr:hypothetical protein A8L45_00220 [Veronia pacifica]
MQPQMPPQHPNGFQAQPQMWPPHMWMQHPAYAQPGMMPPPVHWQAQPQMQQAQPQAQQPADNTQGGNPQSDAMMEQAQAMLEGVLGEEVSMYKELLGSFGMNDKEFWKGAMVGAAAALLLSNENVRGKLVGLVAGAGDKLKSGGCAVKDTAAQTASSVRENITTGSEIFRDTYAASKQGFQESVERHNQEKQSENVQQEQTDKDDTATA